VSHLQTRRDPTRESDRDTGARWGHRRHPGVPARVCDNCGEEYLDETTRAELLPSSRSGPPVCVQCREGLSRDQAALERGRSLPGVGVRRREVVHQDVVGARRGGELRVVAARDGRVRQLDVVAGIVEDFRGAEDRVVAGPDLEQQGRGGSPGASSYCGGKRTICDPTLRSTSAPTSYTRPVGRAPLRASARVSQSGVT
jgi:hypothetical protein